MEYWTIVLSILAGILAIYYYLSLRDPNELQQHGIPHTNDSLLQTIWKLFVRQRSFAESLKLLYNLHSDAKYVGVLSFSKPIVIIRDLELIKSIAIKNFDTFHDRISFGNENQDQLFGMNLVALRGDKWHEVRTLLSPAFTANKMRTMFQLISECAVNFSEYLVNVPSDKRVMEMKDIFSRYANDVIASCAFGVNVDSMKDPENEFYTFGKKATNLGVISIIKVMMYQTMPKLMRLLNLKIIDDRTNDFFVNLVADTIRIRDEKGVTRPDVIQLLMDSRSKKEPGKEMTILNITAQMFIFFFAGFETSSTLMSFAAHEIAVNSDIQEKLQNEIDMIMENTNGQPTYEAINEMKYLNAVINESLRMYPAQVMTDRLCGRDFELPATLSSVKPYLVKKGTFVWFPFYGLHHDPKYFPQPDKFNPERFLDGSNDQCNLNAYLPFGLGPRMCIGNRFALMETRTLLFHLLARCKLKPCEKTSISVKLEKTFAFRIEGGFWLTIEPRENPHHTITETNQSSRLQSPI